MIFGNSTKNFRVVHHIDPTNTDIPHFDIYSYDERICAFYPDTNTLIIDSEFIDYSRTTNIHYKLAIGWAIYYFGNPILITNNEWLDIKCNAPAMQYVRKVYSAEICGIHITKI